MNNTLKSTFIILACAVGLTACNAHNPHHVSTASALVVGVGVGSLLHGHNGYRHSHRYSRSHSHHRAPGIRPVRYGHHVRPVRSHTRPHKGPKKNHRPYRPYHPHR